MAKNKRPFFMVRLARSFEETRDFDLIFWKKVGTQGLFSATWKMVEDLYKWGNRRGHQQRLQRSVAVLKSREG
jgi:hypothetical protein